MQSRNVLKVAVYEWVHRNASTFTIHEICVIWHVYYEYDHHP